MANLSQRARSPQRPIPQPRQQLHQPVAAEHGVQQGCRDRSQHKTADTPGGDASITSLIEPVYSPPTGKHGQHRLGGIRLRGDHLANVRGEIAVNGE